MLFLYIKKTTKFYIYNSVLISGRRALGSYIKAGKFQREELFHIQHLSFMSQRCFCLFNDSLFAVYLPPAGVHYREKKKLAADLCYVVVCAACVGRVKESILLNPVSNRIY